MDPLHHRKSINFQDCLHGKKIGTHKPPGLRKTSQIDPEIQNNDLCGKLVFAIPSLRNLVFRALGVQMSTHNSVQKVTWKKRRKDIKFSSLRPQQVFKFESQKKPKMNENPIPGSPRVHPAAPMVLQGPPEVPKWSPRVPKWRHQAP